MPNKTANDEEREKYDHSDHPTHTTQQGDLHVPGHGGGKRPADMNEVPGETLEERSRAERGESEK